MGFLHGNSTCPLPKDAAYLILTPEPFIGSLTFQRLILYISLGCTGVVSALSFWLIFKHLHRYTEPRQQRQIIRIIFTPVVFAAFSVFAIVSYDNSVYFIPLRDLYEVFALASLFYLFTEYVSPDPGTRDEIFSNLEQRKKKGSRFSRSKEYTVVPGGSLIWFRWIWIMIFIYVFVMIITTIAAEISHAVGTFCMTSLSPHFANIWISVIQNIAVTVAVTKMVMFYARLQREPEFAIHRPLVKLISLKLIVGVNFFQDIVFTILIDVGALKGSHSITGKDLVIGLPALIVAIEQIIFAVFFHYAFRSREYHESEKQLSNNTSFSPRMGVFRAAAHAFNPYDLLYGMARAFYLLISGGVQAGPGQTSGAAAFSMGDRGRRGGRGAYQQAPTSLEPLRGDYPPAYGQGLGESGLYQPRGQTYQSPYYSPGASQSQTQHLDAGDEMVRYDHKRSSSRTGSERELYNPEAERQRLYSGALPRRDRSSSSDGRNAETVRSMV